MTVNRTRWIDSIDRIVLDVVVGGEPCSLVSKGINRGPPAQPRCIIPRPIIREAGLLISLLPLRAISLRRLGLAAHGLIRSASVGIVFFVRDDLCLLV